MDAVRDDFRQAVKNVLAGRAANRCSNPACRTATSGPGLEPDTFSNVGVAAHITAASPGGARYDASLSREERSGAANGIWLCQTCAHLVDTDEAGYPVELLQWWKAEAEELARTMLREGTGAIQDSLELRLPAQDSPDALLSFASTAIARVGRAGEMADLTAFLDSDKPFAWWVWTGPAGVGKSRLAVEFARRTSGTWKSGFLPEQGQERLGVLQPAVPTLVIIDYAASRSRWLSDTLLRLSQRDHGPRIRVLILERSASGPWWDTVQRLHRIEESFEILATMHKPPRSLAGLSRDELRTLITKVATHAGTQLTPTNLEDIADHAEMIDPDRRPLFGLVATFDWLDNAGVSAGRDDALRRLLARMDGQTAAQVTSSPEAAPKVRNLRTLATALGGIPAGEYTHLLVALQPPANLLPGLTDGLLGLHFEDFLGGIRPDILGELYVLDRLTGGYAEHALARQLLGLAWRTDEGSYAAFVERAAGDHAEHERLVDLLDVDGWQDSPVAAARLAADAIPLLGRSDHPALDWIFARLEALLKVSSEPAVKELAVTAQFRFANLIFSERRSKRASELYSDAMADADPAWPVHSAILVNRGATWLNLGDKEAAKSDWTVVIESHAASYEARACALNNRADLYDEGDDPESAIADRTAVLALPDTTYDRRFIAYARRARARWKLGQDAAADEDIESILATPDIAVEQKMNARLLRARWLIGVGRSADARPDLQTIISSNRNFAEIEAKARELLADL
jgi:tetratricopeptide (TPR) repeat protein